MNICRVKICGITNLEDALYAADAGADMLGFVFYPQSLRYVQPERVRNMILALRTRGNSPKCVGVFVNENLERVRAVTSTAQLDLVQLHGDEPVETVTALSPHAFKALRLLTEAHGRAAASRYHAPLHDHVPAFLVDAYSTDNFGGTGSRANWSVAARLAREYCILLAGGLSPQNVAEAIRTVMPWGVDVSSGVERALGLKDHAKVREFIQRAKNVGGG